MPAAATSDGRTVTSRRYNNHTVSGRRSGSPHGNGGFRKRTELDALLNCERVPMTRGESEEGVECNVLAVGVGAVLEKRLRCWGNSGGFDRQRAFRPGAKARDAQARTCSWGM